VGINPDTSEFGSGWVCMMDCGTLIGLECVWRRICGMGMKPDTSGFGGGWVCLMDRGNLMGLERDWSLGAGLWDGHEP
jgi:hypothetical protein